MNVMNIMNVVTLLVAGMPLDCQHELASVGM
jgi:hypothetical protein